MVPSVWKVKLNCRHCVDANTNICMWQVYCENVLVSWFFISQIAWAIKDYSSAPNSLCKIITEQWEKQRVPVNCILNELFNGCICNRAWLWCNKLRCAGIISEFTTAKEGGRGLLKTERQSVAAQAPRKEQRAAGISGLPLVCVINYDCLKRRKKEVREGTNKNTKNAFSQVRIFHSGANECKYKKPEPSPTSSFSLISCFHSPVISWPLPHHVSKFTLILQPILYYIHFIYLHPLTCHLSSLLPLHIFLCRPCSQRLVNFSLSCWFHIFYFLPHPA